MPYLQLNDKQVQLRVGETRIGAGPEVDIRIPGVLAGASGLVLAVADFGRDSQVAIRRASPDALVRVNGVQLGAEPTPLIHGDKIEIGGTELYYGDDRKGGSTQFISSTNLPDFGRLRGPMPTRATAATGGRVISLVDGREYSVGSAGIVFGRDAGCDIVIPSSDVSRRHAEIVAGDSGYVLTDTSTNGLFVNGDRIEGMQILGRGDILKIGPEEFRFYADSIVAAAPSVSAGAPQVPQSAPRAPTGGAAPALPSLRPADPAARPPTATPVSPGASPAAPAAAALPPARPSAPPATPGAPLAAPRAPALPPPPPPPPSPSPSPRPAPVQPVAIPWAPPAPVAGAPAAAPAETPVAPVAASSEAGELSPAVPATRPPPPSSPHSRAAIATLEVIGGGLLRGQRYAITMVLAHIGRGEHNDVVIAEESVSDSHAKLQRRDGVWYVTDLGSTNGTYVGGRRIEGEEHLGQTADLRVGGIKLAFAAVASEPSTQPRGATREFSGVGIADAGHRAPPPPARSSGGGSGPPDASAVRPPRLATREPAPPPPTVRPSRRSGARWLWILIVVAAAVGAALYFFKGR